MRDEDDDDAPTEEHPLPLDGASRGTPSRLLDDRSQVRLVEAMQRYREATRHVELLLAVERLGKEQPFLFSLNRRPVENIARHSKALALAEFDRRAARAALHSLAELIALDPVPSVMDLEHATELAETRHWHASLTEEGASHDTLRHTDRLIMILEYADANGCTYTDETFLPVDMRHDLSEPAPSRTSSSRSSGSSSKKRG